MVSHQPGLPVTGCVVDDVLIAGQRVANQDGIAARGVERAVGLIGDLPRAEIDAGVEPQRIVRRKAHHRRMRIVRFARAVGKIERGADVGHRYFPECHASRRGAAADRGRSKGRK